MPPWAILSLIWPFRCLSASSGLLLDFTYPGAAPNLQKADVVGGSFAIELALPLNHVAELASTAKSTLADICPTSWPVQVDYLLNPESAGQDVLQMRFFYYILPSGGTASCTDDLYPADQPVMIFSRLLFWRFRQHISLPSFVTTLSKWKLTLDRPTLVSCSVRYSHPLPPVPMLSAGHAKDETLQMSWATSRDGTADFLAGDVNLSSDEVNDISGISFDPTEPVWDCSLAGSPCTCAARMGCVWRWGRCISRAGPVNATDETTCEQCPSWPWCPTIGNVTIINDTNLSNITYINYTANVKDPATCGSTNDPCFCKDSVSNCKWNETAMACQWLGNGSSWLATTCESCARQRGCSAPSIVDYVPPLGAGPMDLYDEVTLTFDRLILLPIVKKSAAMKCEGYSAWKTLDDLRTSGRRLTIQVSRSHANEHLVKCYLLLSEGAVEDPSGLRFPGLMYGEYAFHFRDNVPPKFVTAIPEHGTTGVKRETNVQWIFSEEVTKTASFLAYLLILDEGNSYIHHLNSTAMIVETYTVDSLNVKTSGNKMTFKMRGLTNLYGRTFSIMLVRGLQDPMKNEFDASSLVYTFTTEKNPFPDDSITQSSGVYLFPIVIIAIVVVAVTGGLLIIWPCRKDTTMRFRRIRASIRGAVFTSKVTPAPESQKGSGFRHSMAWDLNATVDTQLEEEEDNGQSDGKQLDQSSRFYLQRKGTTTVSDVERAHATAWK
eukprot:gb/GFBE01022897.1/.p1 GENE.gb/GFBE01022897.1/~~gb/GFBE01022897.1/.p1  ORF type:complete len:720 (+),score=116.34 gb/GFBE01022897.1/:1-2160(+)